MSVLIRLSNVVFSNKALPSIQDFGFIPNEGLRFYYDNSTDDYLADASGLSNDAYVVAGSDNFTLSNGLLSADSGVSILQTPIYSSGLQFTHVVVMKSDVAALSYLFRQQDARGINMYRLIGKVGFQYFKEGGGNVSGEFASNGKSYSDWVMYALASDGINIYGSLDGESWQSVAIAAEGVDNVPSGSSGDQLELGSSTSGQQLEGLLGLSLSWDRKLSDKEIGAVFSAAKTVMKSKGVDLV